MNGESSLSVYRPKQGAYIVLIISEGLPSSLSIQNSTPSFLLGDTYLRLLTNELLILSSGNRKESQG